MHHPLTGFGVSLALFLGAAVAHSQTVTFDYTSLNYSPDGGATTYATSLNAVSGNLVVGTYYTDAGNQQDGEGSNGVIFDLTTSQWSVVAWPGSTLNRTDINGIDNGTYVGAYATIYPDPNDHDRSAWLGTYGFIGGSFTVNEIRNPNVDEHKEKEGTYLTSIWLSSPNSGTFVGYYVDEDGYGNGFVNQFTDNGPGTYASIDGNSSLIPSDVEGSRIVGNLNTANGFGQFQVGFYYDGTEVTYLQAPWAVDPNNPGTIFSTTVGGISGDWIAGSWYDAENWASGFLYNLVTEEWFQVNGVPGSQNTYINGIDGNTIVGYSTTVSDETGTISTAFIGTTNAVPEPATVSLVVLTLAALALKARRRMRMGPGN